MRFNPLIKCKDGFSISVQANSGAYCHPRIDNAESYSEVECGFPSTEPITEAFKEYAEDPEDYCETVYGYVPIDVVFAEIDAHGGVKDYAVTNTIPVRRIKHDDT